MARRARRARRGRFVVVEGLDGAGTTTQTAAIARALRADQHDVVTTREPSDGPIGVLIRQALTRRVSLPNGQGPLAPETLALLFAADRTDHLHAEILPALERGAVVLSDRYLLSSLAYQGASLPMDWVEQINALATAPDLTLFLRVGAAMASRRRQGRGGERELFETDPQQRRIRRQYERAIAARRRAERILVLDGALPAEEVTRQALAALAPLLKPGPMR